MLHVWHIPEWADIAMLIMASLICLAGIVFKSINKYAVIMVCVSALFFALDNIINTVYMSEYQQMRSCVLWYRSVISWVIVTISSLSFGFQLYTIKKAGGSRNE